MATITVRNLNDHIKQRLRVRAAQHGRSMEAEVRAIIVAAVGGEDEQKNFLVALREAAMDVGGVDLDIPPRSSEIRAADFGE